MRTCLVRMGDEDPFSHGKKGAQYDRVQGGYHRRPGVATARGSRLIGAGSTDAHQL